ncbi:MAG: hypothetical protein JST70_16240 [Bacteroidetes bacterium]|nr:hypothetical protein [Bacteroidota bacterium]
MRKITLILLLTIAFVYNTYADVNASASASQTIQLVLAPAIEINTTGVVIGSGKQGANQSFTVKSNNEFTISVNTVAANQHVTVALADNNTDGQAAKDGKNLSLSTTARNLLSHCSRSNDQTFAVNYKAKSNATVVYTATQP